MLVVMLIAIIPFNFYLLKEPFIIAIDEIFNRTLSDSLKVRVLENYH
jgi:hypothetical protein